MSDSIDWDEYDRQKQPIDWAEYDRMKAASGVPDVAGWPRQIAQGVVRGAHNRVLGIRGAVDDLGRWGRAEFGMPYSDDRQRLIQEVHDAKQAAKDASIPDKVGQFVYSTAEGAALPMVNRFGFAGGLLTDTLGSGMLGLLDPAETPDERMNNAKTGLVFGAGARPMGVLGSIGLNTGRNVRSMVDSGFRSRDSVRAAAQEIDTMRRAALERVGKTGEEAGAVDVGSITGGGGGSGGGGGGSIPDRWNRLPGLQPTAAMVYQTPTIMQLEKTAATRNGDLFLDRYLQNQKAVHDALASKGPEWIELPNGNVIRSDVQAREAVNAQTSPLRDQVFDSIRSTMGMGMPNDFTSPLRAEIARIRSTPGLQLDDNALRVANEAEKLFRRADKMGIQVDPADLYALKKRLNDMLESKGPVTDAATNAAKQQINTVMGIRKAIDNGLDTAAGGGWRDYLGAHQSLMGPVNELSAMGDLLESLGTKTLPGHPDVPEITRNRLAMADRNFTRKDLGKTGLQDVLSPDTRSILDQSVDAVQAMEHARGGTNAVIGSQTAPLIFAASKPALRQLGKATKFGWALDLADALGKSHGQMALDDALLNPEKLPAVLKAYESGQLGAEYSPLAQAIKRAIRNGNGLLGD